MTEHEHQPVTAEELAEWRRLCDAATPGPWEVKATVFNSRVVSPSGVVVGDWGMASYLSDVDNGKFIAASRQAMPRLLAEVERLRGLLKQCAPFAPAYSELGAHIRAAGVE